MGSLISGKTKVLGVIGDPIEHTMSPMMHNAALRALGLEYVYLAFPVRKEELGKAIAGMRALNIVGLNVTIPHKVEVIKYLDELDPLARMIGSVNTIVNEDGKLTGYNTDALGFIRPLEERGIDSEEKKIVLLGAGGAARAIAFILTERGAELTILNRTLKRAKDCAAKIKDTLKKEIGVLELNRENLAKAIAKADILVNTTSIGMSPNSEATPVPEDLLQGGLLVYDIVYNPMETRLLREAKKAGATTIDGAEMLLWQGALALERWTHVKAPLEIMMKELTEALTKHED